MTTEFILFLFLIFLTYKSIGSQISCVNYEMNFQNSSARSILTCEKGLSPSQQLEEVQQLLLLVVSGDNWLARKEVCASQCGRRICQAESLSSGRAASAQWRGWGALPPAAASVWTTPPPSGTSGTPSSSSAAATPTIATNIFNGKYKLARKVSTI